MRPVASTTLKCAAVALALTVAVAGCGRRGALEPPPGGKTLPTDEAAEAPKAGDQAAQPGARFGKPRQPIQRPKTPFILDPLL